MMRPALLAAVMLALLSGAPAARVQATASAPARAAKSAFPPMLGISYRSPRGALAWFDPATLEALRGRKAPLAGHTGSWAFSADRGVLAIASCAGDAEPRPGIRLVDARAMRVLGEVRLSAYRGCAWALTWLRRDRLLAVASGRAGDAWQLVVVDPVARRVLRRVELPASPMAFGRTGEELVLLLDSLGAFAPARVLAVDAEGTGRLVSVGRILAGMIVDRESADHRSRTIQPGLAVDPDGRRAFLVPPQGPVAEIDLRTLAVGYHELDRPSLLRRLLRWLVPAAQAKALEGRVREARWLGDGLVAVSGVDYSIVGAASGEERVVAAPAGLSLIDTRSWSARVLDREASGFAVAPGLVVAQGGRWDSGQERRFGPGLRAFSVDGRERWRLHAGEYRSLEPAGPVGYVYLDEYPGGSRVEVVDLATGRVVGTIGRSGAIESWPQLLAAQSSGW